jgi:hypothetical protein
MTPGTARRARQDLLLRNLLEWAELREMCLRVLMALSGQDLGCPVPLPALRVVRDRGPRAVR